MIKKVYLHSDKGTMRSVGEDLNDDALNNFIYALIEVELTLYVDETTGIAEIIKVNGIDLIKPTSA